MDSETMIVRIEGEPFLTRAVAYREARLARIGEWNDAARSFGGVGINSARWVQFVGPPPAGWCKKNRHGFSHPKKGSDAIEVLRSLAPMPETRDIFGDAIKENYAYELPCGAGNGGGAIGYLFYGPVVSWANDIFVAVIPDASAAAKRIKLEHPDAILTCGCDKWELPCGLTRITKAEKELIFAQAAVEAERAETAP